MSLTRHTPLKRTKLDRSAPLRSRKKPKKKPRKASQRTLKARADKLCGDWFRASECACKGQEGHVCCGRIEWAHLKSRGILCVRHSPLNALPLCWKAHKHYTLHPDLFYAFVESKFPGRWDFLNARIKEAMDSHEKPDYQQWVDFYSGRSDCYSEWARGAA